MDTLTLKSLCFRAQHGFYKEERQKGNHFEVDVILTSDFRQAGNTDDLSDTVDYQQILEVVASVMNGPSVKLIETLAKRIGDRLWEAFPGTTKLKVAVRKLHPPLDVETAYSEICMSWPR